MDIQHTYVHTYIFYVYLMCIGEYVYKADVT